MTDRTEEESKEDDSRIVHPDSLESLRCLCSSDPNIGKQLSRGLLDDNNSNNDNNKQNEMDDTKVSYWIKASLGAIQFDDAQTGHVIKIDLGGHGKRIKTLPSKTFTKLTQLKTLNLGGTDLPCGQIINVWKECSTVLEELYLGGNGLRDSGVEQIVNEFLLSSTVMNNDKLISSTEKKAYPLRKLDLRYNDIGPPGAKALSVALMDAPFLSSLQSLYLEGNELGNEGASHLAEALNCNKVCGIQELYLGANKIGPDGAKALAKCVGTQTSLAKLYLEGNEIGPDGAAAFTTALTKMEGNSTLKKLFVDNNQIGKLGSQELAKSLNSDTAIGDNLGPSFVENRWQLSRRFLQQ